MEHNKTTLLYVGAAVLLALIAWFATPSDITPDAFLEQGEKFFPDFTDPTAARSLEIVEVDPETGSPRPFKVQNHQGVWTIPSHHDYPADAKDRLAETAAGVIDIRKDDFRSDNVSDHAATGTVDPLDESATTLEGAGKRVTIRGENDVILADFVVGNQVSGRPGMRFVRVPGQKRVYAAKVDVDLSTRFADWINTDLLEVTKPAITNVTINDYSINERTGSVNDRDRIRLSRQDNTWRARNMNSGQVIDSIAMDQLLNTLDSLQIVGVRPKPEGISKSLSAAGGDAISQADALSLQSKGFFLTREGQLVANEGELQFQTDDGVVYVLRFGEVLYGSGLELTAGTGETGDQQKGAENRYLMVTSSFDQSLLPEPPKPSNEEFRSKADSLLTDADRKNRELAQTHGAWQRRVERGKEKAAALADRFADWYYVISADSFERLKRPRDELVIPAG